MFYPLWICANTLNHRVHLHWYTLWLALRLCGGEAWEEEKVSQKILNSKLLPNLSKL